MTLQSPGREAGRTRKASKAIGEHWQASKRHWVKAGTCALRRHAPTGAARAEQIFTEEHLPPGACSHPWVATSAQQQVALPGHISSISNNAAASGTARATLPAAASWEEGSCLSRDGSRDLHRTSHLHGTPQPAAQQWSQEWTVAISDVLTQWRTTLLQGTWMTTVSRICSSQLTCTCSQVGPERPASTSCQAWGSLCGGYRLEAESDPINPSIIQDSLQQACGQDKQVHPQYRHLIG